MLCQIILAPYEDISKLPSTPRKFRLDVCAGEAYTKLCAGCGPYWSVRVFRRPGVFSGKCHQNTRRGRMAAPLDLEPPEGLGFGFNLGWGLGSARSGPTFKVANNYVHAVPAHSGSRKFPTADDADSRCRRPFKAWRNDRYPPYRLISCPSRGMRYI